MIKNNFYIKKICNKIAMYNDFVLYGAGYMARRLIETLVKEHCIPQYCIVSDLTGNPENIEKIPVYGLRQKENELKKGNTLVIVSVSYRYEAEILNALNQAEIMNVMFLSEYCCDFGLFKELYMDGDFEWHMSRMREWYFECNGTNLDIPALLQNKKQDCILFVVANLSSRTVKMLQAFKNRGERLVVILGRWIAVSPSYEIWCSHLERICEIHLYKCIEELLFLLLQNKGKAIHVFSSPWNLLMPYMLVKFQSDIGKVVFDEYDIANGFYTIFDENTLQMERYCLENADGICYREFSLEYLKDVLLFNIKGKTIRFFDYCSGKGNRNSPKDEKGLSLCYVGEVNLEKEYPNFAIAIYMSFIEMCEQNQCHLHIYPTFWDEKRYKTFIEKDKESMYFHFHMPVAYDDLINELSQYDYGIMPVTDDVLDKEVNGYYTKYKYIYAAANKFFDYIDARLPIIAAAPLKMAEYLEKMGVLVNWTNGQYDFDYLRANKTVLKANVEKAREDFLIDNQIQRLEDFYESLND